MSLNNISTSNTNSLVKYLKLIPLSAKNWGAVQMAYKFGGVKAAATLGTALSIDKFLIDKGIETKNWLSTSVFWGGIGYKSVKAVHNSQLIFKYKIALQIFFGGVAAGMIFLGQDNFKSDSNLDNALKSIIFTAKILDRTGGKVEGLEKAYEESSIQAAKYTAQNFWALINNPFIKIALLRQGLDVTKVVLLHKFFTNSHLDPSEIFSIMKDSDNSINKILKLSAHQVINKIVQLLYQRICGKLTSNVEMQVATKVAELAFNDEKTSEILATKDVQNISSLMDQVQQRALQEISQFSSIMTMNAIKSTPSLGKSSTDPSKYPTFFLMLSAINDLFNYSNIDAIENYLKLILDKKEEDDPLEEFKGQIDKKMGGTNIRIHTDIKREAFQNIQEIAVMGGLPFMLNRVKLFIKLAAAQPQEQNETFLKAFIELFKNLIINLSYVAQFSAFEIKTSQELLELDQSIRETMNVLGLEQMAYTISFEESDPLLELKKKFQALTSTKRDGPSRLKSQDIHLKVRNYDLFLNQDNKHILHIKNLEFKPGIVYAIKGPIGTGKTTFLTDIAGCLAGAFHSSGEIYYPTSNEEILPKIFCRIKSFAFTKVNFFERLTYRMPKEYAEQHHDELIRKAKELFQTLNQQDFAQSIDFDSRAKADFGSTGQEKITILISAILYKQYLGKPVLLALDETLANLDDETRNLICDLVKNEFKDSIIISVDHQAGHNSFYNQTVNLQDYRVDTTGNAEELE